MFKLNEQPRVIASRLKSDEQIDFYKAVVALPLKYYCPNGAQEKYINVVAGCLKKSKIPVILCRFANGVGKTTTTIHILLNIIFGAQNGWFDYPLFQRFPYPQKIWYVSTAAALQDTIQPMFEELVLKEFHPEFDYKDSKDNKHIISRITFKKNGWQIFFKTFNQDPKTFESASVGIIVMDEPAPEEIWKAVKSRRRMGCISLLPMTPLDCPPYIIDEIKKAADQKRKGYHDLEADVYQACMKRGIRGHLDPNIVDEMVAGYDVEEREARVFGRFMYFSRLIYRGLDENKHLVDPEDYPIPLHSKLFQIVDPHDSRPCACIWMAKAPNGRIIIFDEYPFEQDRHYWEFKTGLPVHDEVRQWISAETRHKEQDLYPAQHIHRILDRHFGWQTRGKKTFAQLFQEAGRDMGVPFNFMASYPAPSDNKEVEFGHKVVRKLLLDMEDGKPGLVIWNTCYHTWDGLIHYIKRKNTGKAADEKADSDGIIIPKYADLADVVRYGACTDIQAVEPVPGKSAKQQQWEQVKNPNFKKKAKGYLAS